MKLLTIIPAKLDSKRLTKKNIRTFRPKIGIGAEHYFNILGKKASKNIKKSFPIYRSNLSI